MSHSLTVRYIEFDIGNEVNLMKWQYLLKHGLSKNFFRIRIDFQYTKLEICLETLWTIQSVLGNILNSIEFSDNIQGLFAHTKMDRKTFFYRGKKSVEFFFFIFNANRKAFNVVAC